MRSKEHELNKVLTQIKNIQQDINLHQNQKKNTGASVIGYEKINELVAKLRDVQAKNDSLSAEVKYMNNISSQ